MNFKDLNIYPDLVPCLNPTCDNSPLRIPVATALAVLEYRQLRSLNNNKLKAICNICQFENEYDVVELLKYLPDNKRPKLLPVDQIFVLNILRLSDDHTIVAFGELLRGRSVDKFQQYFIIQLLDESEFSDQLKVNDFVACEIIDGRYILLNKVIKVEDNYTPTFWQMKMPKKRTKFGMYLYSNKKIVPANLKCANPSCNYHYSKTSTELRQLLESNHYEENIVELNFTIECPSCGVNRVIIKEQIDSLYQI